MALTIAAGANVAFSTGTGGASNVITFTGCNSGTNFPNGSTVVVAVGWYSGAGQTAISGVTIGGIAGTAIVASGGAGNNQQVNLFYAVMTSALTDTVVVTGANNNFSATGVGCLIMTGAAATPTANSILTNVQPDPQTPATSISLPSGGVGIATLISCDAGAIPTPNWSTTGNSAITSSTGDINTSIATHNTQLVMAHSNTANASWLPSISGTGGAYDFSASMACVTWAAGGGGSSSFPQILVLGVG